MYGLKNEKWKILVCEGMVRITAKKTLIVLWVVFFICTACVLISYGYSSMVNRQQNDRLSLLFSENGITDFQEEDIQVSEQIAAVIDDTHNADIVGWIRIPGTDIDYPVVQSTDNHFYLTHDIYRQEANAGAIFMDYRNNAAAGGRNTIVYGHNMRDGSMFQNLLKYRNRLFFYQNNMIELSTQDGFTQWQVFSAYTTDTSFNFIQVEFQSDEDYAAFLDEIIARSIFAADVTVSTEDSVLTLSTCAYDLGDKRFVIHAYKV